VNAGTVEVSARRRFGVTGILVSPATDASPSTDDVAVDGDDDEDCILPSSSTDGVGVDDDDDDEDSRSCSSDRRAAREDLVDDACSCKQ
jgi:hypothetical protein